MPATVVEEPRFRFRRYVFKDREHAAALLAEKVRVHADEGALVLAIPAGGVPVGKIVAERLGCAFELAIVRKIQIPWEPEAGFGAISWSGEILLNEPLVAELGLSQRDIAECAAKTRREIMRRMETFRGGRQLPEMKGRTVIVVDDGLASGYTMLAAIRSVKRLEPRRVVVAVPTASSAALELIAQHADVVVCLNLRSEVFFAVADAYEEWQDLSDDDVLRYLRSQ